MFSLKKQTFILDSSSLPEWVLGDQGLWELRHQDPGGCGKLLWPSARDWGSVSAELVCVSHVLLM